MAIRITEDQWKKLVDRNYYNEQLRQLGVATNNFRNKYADDYLQQWRSPDELRAFYEDVESQQRMASALSDYYKKTGNSEYDSMSKFAEGYNSLLADRKAVSNLYGGFETADDYNRMLDMLSIREDADFNTLKEYDEANKGYYKNLISFGELLGYNRATPHLSANEALWTSLLEYNVEAMTSEERENTVAILNKYGEDAATEYLDMLAPVLAQRDAEKFYAIGQKHPVISSVVSVPTNLLSAIELPISMVTGTTNKLSNITTSLRGGVSSDMGGVGSFFYNTGMSAVDSVTASLISKAMGIPAGEVVLGLSAAANTQNDILRRGGTQGQAVIGGLAAGIAEGFFEHFSIGSLSKMSAKDLTSTFKAFVKNATKEIAINASEEAATEVANILNDAIIMGELSNFNTMVEQYGYEEAILKTIHQIGEAAASGALMGFGFSAGGAAITAPANYATGSAVTKNAMLYDKINKQGATLSLDVDNKKTAEARNLYSAIQGYNEAQQKGEKIGKLKTAQHRANVGTFANMLAYDADVNAALKKLNTGAKQNVSQTVQTAEKVSKEANISKDNAEVTKSAMPQIVKAEGQELSQIYIEKDGNMVSLDKVAIEDADLAAAYSYAVTTGSVENANSFLKSYALSTTNASPTAFWSAWMGIAANGQTLKTTEENQAKVFAEYGDIIGDDAKLAAWLSGVTMKQTASERRIKAAEQARAEWEKGGQKVTKAKIDATELQGVELDAKQKEFVAFGRLFAEAFGINVKFVASKKGNRGDNGKYNRTTNTITLDVFSGIDNNANYNAVQSALSNTLSHEVVHNMRIVTPEVYDILSEYVFETLKAQGMDIDARIQYYIDEAKREENKTMSREDAIEEIVAHACDGMLQTSETVREFMEGFYAKDKRAANRFSQAVKNVLKRLKQVFESLLGVKAYSAEAHLLYKAGADSVAEIQKIFDQGIANLREGNLARNYEVQGKSEAETASGEMYSLRGVNKDGIEVYETSEEIKKLPIKERQKAFLDIMKNEYRGRTAKFIRNGHAYYASFDYRDINKNIYGDKLSDKKGWKAKINVGAEGEIFELVENSKYDGSKPESGKNIAAHSGVGYWDYFVKTVQIDNTVFDLIANVRKKTDGAFVYSIQLKENKKIKASPSLGSPNGVLNRMLNASANNVAQKTGVVNTNSQNSSDEMKQSRYDQATQTEINESMTMEQAKQMIQRAFVMGGIKEWYDGEYKNGDEWAKEQGADEVALYIDNEYQLQELYVNKIPGILDEKFFIADVVEAYLNGTLTGKVKKKAEKLDLGKSVKVADSRFYAPQAIEKAKALYEIANQRLNDDNRAVVINARAKILLYAHNKGAAETLGISQSDLNKKLRSWSNYSDRARQTSIKINAGIEESNRWTGIENVAYINKSRVSAEEVARMVKAIEGKSDAFQNKYIARTMLALDTHIDWSWLTFKFDSSQGVNDAMIGGSGRANGYYRDSERLIHAITNSPNTIAHEMGHALDHQWARDLGLGNTSLTEAYRNTDRVSGDVKIWFDQFKAFSDSLAESASLYSAYTMDVQEAFARFVAKFVEWTEIVSTGRSSGYETSYYNDKFTTAQFVEFARILQGKAVLDANGLTKNKVTEADVMRQARRDTDYLTAVENGDMETAQRMVDEAAKASGYDSPKLYHGTNRFGFTRFDTNKGHGFIYGTTNSAVAANYGGRDNYAGARPIGKRYISPDSVEYWNDEIKSVIQNAETVFGTKYKVLTDDKRAKIRQDVYNDVSKVAAQLDNAFADFDLPEDIANSMTWVVDLFYTVQENDSEYFSEDADNKAWWLSSLKDSINHFNEHYPKLREYLDNHFDEFTDKQKNYARVLKSYALTDAAIDIEYSYYKAANPTNETQLVNAKTGQNILTREELQSRVDSARNVGAYELYGKVGNKPLRVDANGKDWVTLVVPEMGDNKYHSTDVVAEWAKANGYTSVIVTNVYDGGELADDYIFFNSNQVKSADNVTYDDNGNVIPLSERFDTENEDIRYQRRNVEIGMSEAERSSILKNATISPPEININKDFNVDFRELEKNHWKIVKKPMIDKLRKLGYLKAYTTDQVDISFDFTGEGLRKSMNAQVADYGGNLYDLAKVVMNMQPLLDNSVLMEIHADKAKGTSKENPQLLQTYVLLSAYRESTTITPVQFEIKQYVDNNNRLYLAVALTKIETDVISDTILENQASTRLLPVSEISIPQLIAKINPKDENFFKYVPDDLLNQNQLDAKQRALNKEALKYSRETSELSQKRISTPDPSTLLKDVIRNKVGAKEYGQYTESLKKYQDLDVRARNQEKRIAEIDAEISKLKSEHKQSGKGTRMDELYRMRKTAENKVSEYQRQMFAMETKELSGIVRAETEKARLETQRAVSDKYQQQFEQYKQKSEQKVKELTAHYKQKSLERTENLSQREYIEKIEKKANKLYDLLKNNSKDKHVPEIFQKVTLDFLEALDFSSKRYLNGGEKTKKETDLETKMKKLVDMLEGRASEVDLGEFFIAAGLNDDDAKAMVTDALGEAYDAVYTITKQVGDEDGALVLRQLSSEQLKSINNALGVLSHLISDVNNLVSNSRYKDIAALGAETVKDLERYRTYTKQGLGAQVDKFFNWTNALPFYAFKRMGKAASSIFEAFMDGFDVYVDKVYALLDFSEAALNEQDVKKWSKEIHHFETSDGKDLYMSTADIMSFYCLDKREQGSNHIKGGGIEVPIRRGVLVGDKITKTFATDPGGIVVTDELRARILSTLTSEQIEVAKKLQEYMSTVCAEWGNEISMKRFGVKQFNEKYYFPVRSSENTTKKDDQQGSKERGIFQLLNASFTQALTENANNRIVVDNIFDVFATHSIEMAKYNAFALQLIDTRKWLNYKVKTDVNGTAFKTDELRAMLEKAFGKDAEKYIDTFLLDINGADKSGDRGLDIIRSAIANTKIAAVGLNLNVMLIQPTAYLRASAVISPKYLISNIKDTPQLRKAIKRGEKYSGIFRWKSLGYRGFNLAAPIADRIKHTESFRSKFNESVSMKGAELMDKLTWGALWLACENETAALNKSVARGTEEFYQAVAKRFREVIYATQVVDSPLTKTEFMRSKGYGNAIFGSFMSEPSQSHNMFMDAANEIADDHRKGQHIGKKHLAKLARIGVSLAITEVATATIRSFLDAARDVDDEDEEYWESYIKHFIENILEGLFVPKIPIFNEIISVVIAAFTNGYSSSSLEMAAFEKLARAGKNIWNLVTGKNVSWTRLLKSVFDAVSSIVGLPISNLWRDMVTVYNVICAVTDNKDSMLK